MQIITAANLTNGGSYNNSGSNFVTASISPAINNLLLLTVTSYLSTGGMNIPNVSGGGVSWTQIATIVSSDGKKRITVFRALSPNPTSGTITIDFSGQTQTACDWSVDQFANVDTSGINGAGAVVQAVTNAGLSDGSGNFSFNMGTFQQSQNATWGCYSDLTAADFGGPFAGTGFTLLMATYATLSTEFANNNQSSISWTKLANNVYTAAVGIEIKAYAPTGGAIVGIL